MKLKSRLFLSGLIRIVLGFLAIAYPVEALMDLAFIWGFAVCISGVNYILACFNNNLNFDACPKLFLFLSGLLDLFLGGIMISRLGLTALMIPIFAAAWLALEGLFRIILAFRLIKILRRWWLILLSGIAALLLASAMFVSPFVVGGAYVVSIIAGVLIVSGFCMLFESRLLA